MPQESHVLKCFSCQQFQSHIVKKTNKWECKICGAKQSIKKEYGGGSGKDCRLHTQKLNSLRGVKEETVSTQKDVIEPIVAVEPTDHSLSCQSSVKRNEDTCFKSSKWNEFLDSSKTKLQPEYNFLEDYQTSDFHHPNGYHISNVAHKKHNTSIVLERGGKQIKGPLSSYDENGQTNHVSTISTTSPYLNGIVTCSETTKSDSTFNNVDYIFDFTYGVEPRNPAPNKRRNSNSASSDLKWGVCEPESSANIDNVLSQKNGNSHKIRLLESGEHNYFSTTYQSTSASKMWTSSIDKNTKDSVSDTEYCKLSSLPMFEQSGDPNEIDVQLNF